MHSAPPPPPAIVQRIAVRRSSVTFFFDRRPQTIRASYVPRSKLHDCASDAVVHLPGAAWAVVHFFPARSARRMGPYPTAAKVCDFESDLAWAIARPARQPIKVSRRGATVTVFFSG